MSERFDDGCLRPDHKYEPEIGPDGPTGACARCKEQAVFDTLDRVLKDVQQLPATERAWLMQRLAEWECADSPVAEIWKRFSGVRRVR